MRGSHSLCLKDYFPARRPYLKECFSQGLRKEVAQLLIWKKRAMKPSLKCSYFYILEFKNPFPVSITRTETILILTNWIRIRIVKPENSSHNSLVKLTITSLKTRNKCIVFRERMGPSRGHLFTWNKSLCSPVPQNQNLDFLCWLFPKIAFSPLFPSFLDFVPLLPWNKCPLSPVHPNPWEGLKNDSRRNRGSGKGKW